ncbi:hypothetical protein Tco_0866088 [Tanacetum coccineum]
MGRNGSNCFVRLGLRSRGFKASILHLISIPGASWDFLDQIFAAIDGYRKKRCWDLGIIGEVFFKELGDGKALSQGA